MLQTNRIFQLLLLSFFSFCESKKAIFLLGDSTSGHLYAEGLIPFFNCGQNDTKANRWLEVLPLNGLSTSPRICEHSLVSRIGFAFHWGVSPIKGSYIGPWLEHRTPGDTENSVTNIYMAIDEFQNRSINDDGAVFLFNSNFWDAGRYDSSSPIHLFVSTFFQQYTIVVSEIRKRLRQNDKLICVLSHAVNPIINWKETAHFLNLEIMRAAMTLNIPTIRQDLIAGFIDHNKKDKDKSYLADYHHQNSATNLKIASSINSYIEHLNLGTTSSFEFHFHVGT